MNNKTQPEGSIAETWLAEEILTFCSRYLDKKVETRFNHQPRVNDHFVGATTFFNLTPIEMLQAHRHVLINCLEAERFIQ